MRELVVVSIPFHHTSKIFLQDVGTVSDLFAQASVIGKTTSSGLFEENAYPRTEPCGTPINTSERI